MCWVCAVAAAALQAFPAMHCVCLAEDSRCPLDRYKVQAVHSLLEAFLQQKRLELIVCLPLNLFACGTPQLHGCAALDALQGAMAWLPPSVLLPQLGL
jgi:hypothetical protein